MICVSFRETLDHRVEVERAVASGRLSDSRPAQSCRSDALIALPIGQLLKED